MNHEGHAGHEEEAGNREGRMTARQIARAHCANWRHDNGGCVGAIIEEGLKIRRCMPKPKCVLGTPGQRCRYLEECVLPMARGIDDPVYRQQFEEAIRAYRLAANMQSPTLRKCPICGRGMEPRRRFCPVCAAAKRRESKRTAAAKRRVRSRHLSQQPPLNRKELDAGLGRGGMNTTNHAESAVNCLPAPGATADFNVSYGWRSEYG